MYAMYEQITDRIVVWILGDFNLSEKLQLEQDLNVVKCVTMERNSGINITRYLLGRSAIKKKKLSLL